MIHSEFQKIPDQWDTGSWKGNHYYNIVYDSGVEFADDLFIEHYAQELYGDNYDEYVSYYCPVITVETSESPEDGYYLEIEDERLYREANDENYYFWKNIYANFDNLPLTPEKLRHILYDV
jgi:hypothetical protein